MAKPRIFRSRKKAVKLPSIFNINTASLKQEMQLVPRVYLDNFLRGEGNEDAFLTMVFRVMLGAGLADAVIKVDLIQIENVFLDAVNQLIKIGNRYESLKRWGLHGDEITPIKEAFDLVDQLQELTTMKQQRECTDQVNKFVGGFAYTMANLRKLKAINE